MEAIFQFVQVIVDFFLKGASQKAAIQKAFEERQRQIQAFFDNNQTVEDAYSEEYYNQYASKLAQENETALTNENLKTAGLFILIIGIAILIVYLMRKK